MESGLVVLCLIVMAITYIVRKKRAADKKGKKGKSDYEKTNEVFNNAKNKDEYQTRNFLLKTLTDIGCQYEIDDENFIVFAYQGETFSISANNDTPFIWIYSSPWIEIGINDPDADSLKHAINKANECCAITSLYTIRKEEGSIIAFCKIAIYFAYDIPDYKVYLKSMLNGFFLALQKVQGEFSTLSKELEQKERIEIKGFRPE